MRKAYIEITAFFDILHVRYVSLFYLILLKASVAKPGLEDIIYFVN